MGFKSILGNSKKTGMISSSIGTFIFDVITVENHSSTLRVTENPIETGSNISDHAVLEPKEITISGVMVSYNRPPKVTANSFGELLADYPLAIDVLPVSQRALEVANEFADKAIYSGVGKAVNIAAQFLPNGQASMDISGGDRIKNAFDSLLAIQRSGEPVEVMTHSKLYEDMVLTSITLDQDKESAGEFTVTFREIFIVESMIGSGLIVPDTDMPSQVSKVNLGNTTPRKIDENESALFKPFGKTIGG